MVNIYSPSHRFRDHTNAHMEARLHGYTHTLKHIGMLTHIHIHTHLQKTHIHTSGLKYRSDIVIGGQN